MKMSQALLGLMLVTAFGCRSRPGVVVARLQLPKLFHDYDHHPALQRLFRYIMHDVDQRLLASILTGPMWSLWRRLQRGLVLPAAMRTCPLWILLRMLPSAVLRLASLRWVELLKLSSCHVLSQRRVLPDSPVAAAPETLIGPEEET